MFEAVIKELSERESRRDPVPDKFEKIEPASAQLSFVDGGNAPLFVSPGARVEYVRVYRTTYAGKDRKATARTEGCILITRGKNITVKGHGIDFTLEIPLNDPELCRGREEVELGTVASLARFLLECQAAKEAPGLAVRDGTLQATNKYEEAALAGLHAGLAKTLTSGPAARMHAAIAAQAPVGAWRYPIAENVWLVKLHPQSEYLFRLDGDIAPGLAFLAEDPTFLGYPYPLIEADREARVSNKELQHLKIRFMAEAGKEWKRLQRLSRGSDAHSILDRQ